MKHLFTILLFLFSLQSFGQKIENETYSNGNHDVWTEWYDIEGSGKSREIYIKLEGINVNGKIQWFLLFNPYSWASFSIKQGHRILLKTKDDTVINLICNQANGTSTQYVTFPMVGVKAKYYTISTYIVTEEQLYLISDGITKIRIESDGEVFENTYKKDKIGKFVSKAMQNIKEKLGTSTNFEDNF